MAKTQEIVLLKEVRVFRKFSETDEMYDTQRRPLSKGTVVCLGQARRLVYENRNQWVMPVNAPGLCGDNHFVLIEELDKPELMPI